MCLTQGFVQIECRYPVREYPLLVLREPGLRRLSPEGGRRFGRAMGEILNFGQIYVWEVLCKFQGV